MGNIRTRASVVTWALLAGCPSPAAADQAALEYGASGARDLMRTAIRTVEGRWYYFVGGVLILIFLWSYLRK